jgi:hypothetical protein
MVIQILSLLIFLATDHLQKESPSQTVARIAQTVKPNDVTTKIMVSMGTRWLTFYGFMVDPNRFVKVGGW